MPYVTRRAPPPRHLSRIAVAVAGLVVLGIDWKLTNGDPAAASPAAIDAAPADYVPEDASSGPPPPTVDPLGALEDPMPMARPSTLGPSAPLGFLKVTSSFGPRRHPILGFTRMHQGVDFAAREGAPVLAAADGIVTEAGVDGGYGELIRLRHAGGWGTGYAHLSGFAPGVMAGARVTRGQVIGFVGHTGLVTGPHLHFEVSLGGVKLDPMTTPFGGAPAADPRAGAYARLRPALASELPG